MDKRYQVFVSSTYSDLKEERQHVLQTLMEMDCIPAGMELFPAVDEEQWEFIKKVINDCDYYLLIIGGRYGSITTDGISYTEKEFDYAVSQNLKIIALIHGSPEKIEFGKSESNSELREKLDEFRKKVMTGRLVKFWEAAKELPGLVSLNLTKTIKMYPAIGWIRANKLTNEESLSELNQLRKENAKLLVENVKLSEPQIKKTEDIADFDSKYTIHGESTVGSGSYRKTKQWETEISWKELYLLLAPYLIENLNDSAAKSKIAHIIQDRDNISGDYPKINDQEFKTITIQLKAYGLINTKYTKTTKGGMSLFWSLTEYGEQLMMEQRTIKKEHLTSTSSEH